MTAEEPRSIEGARAATPESLGRAIAQGIEDGIALMRRHELRHQLQEFTDTTERYEAGEDVVPGDCWRAALASLLELPLAEVPHFIHLYEQERDPEPELVQLAGPWWWRETRAWVEQVRPGWTVAAWERPTDGEDWRPIYGETAKDDPEGIPSRVILTAPSPRGAWNHSVLVFDLDGSLAHDPFPDGGGVLEGPGDVVALVRPEWLVGE